MVSLSKTAFSFLLLTSLSACRQDTTALGEGLQPHGWSPICLGRLTLDFPERVLVAESEPSQPSGYGFEPAIQGTATVRLHGIESKFKKHIQQPWRNSRASATLHRLTTTMAASRSTLKHLLD